MFVRFSEGCASRAPRQGAPLLERGREPPPPRPGGARCSISARSTIANARLPFDRGVARGAGSDLALFPADEGSGSSLCGAE